MSIASGFSIQRNDVIQVPHRQQYEVHNAIAGGSVYVLRSLPDFKDKTWDWDIRMGEVRIHLERGALAQAANISNTGTGGVGSQAGAIAATEDEAFVENLYTEGSLVAGRGSVEYNSKYGDFGGLVFNTQSQPMVGEKIEISYVEDVSKFKGDGGLLFQIAHDLCVHPFNSSEIFKSSFGNQSDIILGQDGATGTEFEEDIGLSTVSGGNDAAIVATAQGGIAQIGGKDAVKIYKNPLSIQYKDAFTGEGVEATQRSVKYLWKVVKEHRETRTGLNLTSGSAYDNIVAGDSSTYIELMGDSSASGYAFPLVESDLGGGEFRVAIDNQLLPRDDWTVVSDNANRKSTFKLKRTTPMPWVTDMASVNVTIAYIWKKSLDVPYGALVGRTGLGPNQVTAETGAGSAADLSFPHDDKVIDDTEATPNKYWVFSKAFRSTSKDVMDPANPQSAFFGWHAPVPNQSPHMVTSQADATNAYVGLENVSVIPADRARHKTTAKISDGDLFHLTMEENSEYANPFKLIFPTPLTSSNEIDVKNKLRTITDRFLVESDKGVDLLSDSNLSWTTSNHPASNRKPQKWRLRFEWNPTTLSIKVNVGTEYQLRDDCTISGTDVRDGIKSPIFREPGELCDVYKTPAVGRGATMTISRAKSQWFKKRQIEQDIASTYPMSYKMTCTDHGMGLFVFDQSSVDQDDDYAWFVVQRHVNQTTGEPEFTDKSPVHCVYSPSKRPVDVSSLTPYFATADTEDLSKPDNLYSSLGNLYKTEAPTIYVNRDATFFDGIVNAIDFNGYGYASSTAKGQVTPTTLSSSDIKTDLFRGITGNQGSASTSLWSEKVYSFRIEKDANTGDLPEYVVGHYVKMEIDVDSDPDTNDDWGGRIKFWDPVSGMLTIVSTQALELTGAGEKYDSVTDPDPGSNILSIGSKELVMGSSTTGDVSIDFTPHAGTTSPYTSITDATREAKGKLATVPVLEKTGPSSEITDLAVTGFNSLPRRRDTSIALDASPSPGSIFQVAGPPSFIRVPTSSGHNLLTGTAPAADWSLGNTTASQFSENIIFPSNLLDRMSTFKNASASGTGIAGATENVNMSSFKSGDSALLDILYTAQPNNVDKVFESLVVALDDIEIQRDASAYVLTYDEWVQRGDPNTVPRFLESLDAAGVTSLGPDFRIPNVDSSTLPNFNQLIPGMDPTATGADVNKITFNTNNSSTGRKFFHMWQNWFVMATIPSGWVAGVDYPEWTFTTSNLIQSLDAQELKDKLPGDIIWKNSIVRNEYMYDFWNKSLFFKISPRAGTTFSISMINYQTANPSQGTYIISTPEDRNFPETNMNDIKSINRFIVREKDVLKPWDYHVSATMHEIDSHAIINPQEQLSITQGRNFVFSFPTQLTTQRFYYPESELDLICVSSADFSTQAGYVEIDKYSDSDGKNNGLNNPAAIAMGNAFDGALASGTSANRFEVSDQAAGAYGGHTGPDETIYIWKKNKRKYEGMPSTLPNGNGMRIFLQVTGSSIQHSDVEKGATPPLTSS